MADNAKKGTVMFAQAVAPTIRDSFNKLVNDCERYAIDNRLRAPRKGEVLETIITLGLKKLEPKDFFQNK